MPGASHQSRSVGVHHNAGTDDRAKNADPRTDAAPIDRLTALKTAYHELELELQETNRGVVALYAELDDRAERLRVAEDRFRLMLDSVRDYAIFMLTPEGEIANWNTGAERVFGYPADEIVGGPLSRLFPAPAGGRDSTIQLNDVLRTGRLERNGVCVSRGGSTFWADVVIASVISGTELRGYSVVVHDVTERRRLEADLRQRAQDLAAANRAKEDFLATLSHELRTPLNAMLGWTRLLRTGKLDPASTERALDTIERNARAQEQLIADILDVSRIVTGKLRLQIGPVDLAAIVEAALESIRPAAEAKGVTLERDLGPGEEIQGDPDRLQQVAWNLVANAIKFTPRGGQVHVTLQQDERATTLTVRDSGEGIAPEILPFVFDRFMQGDASATRRHGGLGLGLSIVRHLVELHGGTVSVASEGTGRGSVFSVVLPRI